MGEPPATSRISPAKWEGQKCEASVKKSVRADTDQVVRGAVCAKQQGRSEEHGGVKLPHRVSRRTMHTIGMRWSVRLWPGVKDDKMSRSGNSVCTASDDETISVPVSTQEGGKGTPGVETANTPSKCETISIAHPPLATIWAAMSSPSSHPVAVRSLELPCSDQGVA